VYLETDKGMVTKFLR